MSVELHCFFAKKSITHQLLLKRIFQDLIQKYFTNLPDFIADF